MHRGRRPRRTMFDEDVHVDRLSDVVVGNG